MEGDEAGVPEAIEHAAPSNCDVIPNGMDSNVAVDASIKAP